MSRPIEQQPSNIARLAAELAAVSRMLETMNILSYSGHIAVRIPERNALMIQRRTDSRAELAPDRMLLVDLDGKVIQGDGKPPSETSIHIEAFRARPDVNASLHSHMDLAIAFTMMKGVQLLPMRARATRWKSGIPTHPDPSHIKYPQQGRELAATLGPHHVALMRAHGLLLVAESLPALFSDAVHFQENAQAQMDVQQAGAVPEPLSDAEIEKILALEDRPHHIAKMWNYYIRKGLAAGSVEKSWNLFAA
ncbi:MULTISPECIES: class II aldolase/adducin family protein [unclassified Beijerinckia]|uniref:class II aldolase/adducin family protein n=1 Tax=unclassified Beijerinckia TaxID=2638183 RepID=UPI0008952EDE|nr:MULTISPECIES: class II aldolase/adducin family protein [unclassified Beijerinckia]MDH7798161.1 L-ribulose-5-phosphate 4-epimerase [Beijerinckia sp. GAS462]SED11207.1 L-fuculose-phosphate aldolase [Beijerinckia sp. 28-YEA-48]